MASYRTPLIPRWVWIMSGIAALLIILVTFSVASQEAGRQVIVIGSPVETGDPRDFTEAPPTPPEEEPTPMQPPVIAPPPPPDAPPTIPRDLPETFIFEGTNWEVSAGPMSVDVLTTGEHANGHVIYGREGDRPPYRRIYIETSPNSGQFYEYVPVQSR